MYFPALKSTVFELRAWGMSDIQTDRQTDGRLIQIFAILKLLGILNQHANSNYCLGLYTDVTVLNREQLTVLYTSRVRGPVLYRK